MWLSCGNRLNWDENSDGGVDFSELVLNLSEDRQSLKRQLNEDETNGDKKVSEAELAEYIWKPDLQKALRILDRNGDKNITEDEFLKADDFAFFRD